METPVEYCVTKVETCRVCKGFGCTKDDGTNILRDCIFCRGMGKTYSLVPFDEAMEAYWSQTPFSEAGGDGEIEEVAPAV